MLKYAILGFLNYRAQTGYDLERRMATSTQHFWHAKLSQIYTTLKKLEADGWVASMVEERDGRPDRRIYEITPEGDAVLREWLSTTLTEVEPNKDTLLLKLFFAAQVGKEQIMHQLQAQLEAHRRLPHTFEAESPDVIQMRANDRPDLAADALLWELTRRFGEAYEQMVVAWLEDSLAAVEAHFPDG